MHPRRGHPRPRVQPDTALPGVCKTDLRLRTGRVWFTQATSTTNPLGPIYVLSVSLVKKGSRPDGHGTPRHSRTSTVFNSHRKTLRFTFTVDR